MVRRIIYSIPSLIILSLVTFLLMRGAIRVVSKEQESSGRSQKLTERAAALVIREQKLKDSVAHLETEEGIKDEIKGRFSVTQEGEYVAVIVDEKVVASSTDNLHLPWYKKLWAAIIDGK